MGLEGPLALDMVPGVHLFRMSLSHVTKIRMELFKKISFSMNVETPSEFQCHFKNRDFF